MGHFCRTALSAYTLAEQKTTFREDDLPSLGQSETPGVGQILTFRLADNPSGAAACLLRLRPDELFLAAWIVVGIDVVEF